MEMLTYSVESICNAVKPPALLATFGNVSFMVGERRRIGRNMRGGRAGGGGVGTIMYH